MVQGHRGTWSLDRNQHNLLWWHFPLQMMTIGNSSLAYSPHVCSFPSLLHFLVLWDKLPVAEIIRSFKVRKGLWFMYPISSPCLPPILFRAALTASLQSLSIQVCEKIELGFLFVCVPWWFHFYINYLSSPFCFTWLRIFVENLLYGFVHCLLATFHHSSVFTCVRLFAIP